MSPSWDFFFCLFYTTAAIHYPSHKRAEGKKHILNTKLHLTPDDKHSFHFSIQYKDRKTWIFGYGTRYYYSTEDTWF